MPGLMDYLGNMFGGGQSQDDLTAQMIASMGGDPAAMQRASGLQGLGAFGAAMLANSGPSTTRKGFGQILGMGLQAGQQATQDARTRSVNQLYTAENIKRAQAADEELQRKRAQGEALKTAIAGIPPEQWPGGLGRYANILSNLPGEQVVSLLTNATTTEATNERQDQKDAAAAERQKAQFEQQMTMQERIAARQAAAMNAPAKAPAWFSILSPEEQHQAALAMGGVVPKAGAGGGGRASGAVAARTASDAQALNNSLPIVDSAMQGLDTAEALLKGGKVQLGNIASAISNVAPSHLSPETQQFIQLAKEQIVQGAKSLPGSFSDKEALLSEAASIGLNKDVQSNLATIQRLRQRLGNVRDAGYSRLDWYTSGSDTEPHNVLNFRPAALAGGQAGAPAAGPAAAGGAQRPAGLPAGAQQGPDGNWYDPATGKRYVYRP